MRPTTERQIARAADAIARLVETKTNTPKDPTSGPDKDPNPKDSATAILDIAERIAKLLAAATALVAILYGFGFAILNSYYSQFGLRVFDLSLPTYLASALGYTLIFLSAMFSLVGVFWLFFVNSANDLEAKLKKRSLTDIASKDNYFFGGLIDARYEYFLRIRFGRWLFRRSRLTIVIILGYLVFIGVAYVVTVLVTYELGFQNHEDRESLLRTLSILARPWLWDDVAADVSIISFLALSAYLVFLGAYWAYFRVSSRTRILIRDIVYQRIDEARRDSLNIPSEFMLVNTREREWEERLDEEGQGVSPVWICVYALAMLAFLLITLPEWGKRGYPYLSHALGGGNAQGARVQLVFDQSNGEAANLINLLNEVHLVPIDRGETAPLRVLSEDGTEIIVLLVTHSRDVETTAAKPCSSVPELLAAQRREEVTLRALRISKSLVSGLIYTTCREGAA